MQQMFGRLYLINPVDVAGKLPELVTQYQQRTNRTATHIALPESLKHDEKVRNVIARMGLSIAQHNAQPKHVWVGIAEDDVDEEAAKWQPQVVSSHIEEAGYDEGILYVKFLSGIHRYYRYFDVAEELYIGLLAADSPGKFFDKEIKKGGYAYERIDLRTYEQAKQDILSIDEEEPAPPAGAASQQEDDVQNGITKTHQHSHVTGKTGVLVTTGDDLSLDSLEMAIRVGLGQYEKDFGCEPEAIALPRAVDAAVIEHFTEHGIYVHEWLAPDGMVWVGAKKF